MYDLIFVQCVFLFIHALVFVSAAFFVTEDFIIHEQIDVIVFPQFVKYF